MKLRLNLKQNKTILISFSQYCSCWWLSEAQNQAIKRHGSDLNIDRDHLAYGIFKCFLDSKLFYFDSDFSEICSPVPNW